MSKIVVSLLVNEKLCAVGLNTQLLAKTQETVEVSAEHRASQCRSEVVVDQQVAAFGSADIYDGNTML